MKRAIFLLTLLLSFNVWGNVAVFDYQVLEFKNVGENHYLIKIIKADRSEEAYTVHIKFRPQCYSRMEYKTTVEEEYTIFKQAISVITEALNTSNTITLGRKSGTGFLKSTKEGNGYVAESIRLLNTGKKLIPYFQHHNLGVGLCKNA